MLPPSSCYWATGSGSGCKPENGSRLGGSSSNLVVGIELRMPGHQAHPLAGGEGTGGFLAQLGLVVSAPGLAIPAQLHPDPRPHGQQPGDGGADATRCIRRQYLQLVGAHIGNGSTATWNASKTNVNVKINAGATYGVIVLPPSIKLYGDFVKQ